MPERMKSVLFVCTTHRYRSPYAEAVFRKWLLKDGKVDEYRVGSAGTWTREKYPVIPSAFYRDDEIGLNLREHDSVEVNREILSAYNLIVVMEKGHKEALRTEFSDFQDRVFLLSEIVDDIDYDIVAPMKAKEDVDAIIGVLYNLLQNGASKICGLASEMFNIQVTHKV